MKCRLTVDDLEPERQYQFWVTAVTNAGEGMRSDIVVQTPTKRGKSEILQQILFFLIGAYRTTL